MYLHKVIFEIWGTRFLLKGGMLFPMKKSYHISKEEREWMERLSAFLKMKAKLMRLSQREVQNQINLLNDRPHAFASNGHITRIFNGSLVRVSMIVLMRLAKVLDFDPHFLLFPPEHSVTDYSDLPTNYSAPLSKKDPSRFL